MPGTTQKTILVVDDEELVRSLMKDILSFNGFEIITANNGVEGLEKITSGEKIHLVISDISMPEMDGLTLLAKTRKEGIEIPFFIISGHASGIKLPAEEASIESPLFISPEGIVSIENLPKTVVFFKKPFSPLALRKMVQELLR